MVFENVYNSKEKEKQIREFWEKEQIFKFNKNSKKPIFSIDTPPPTMSGKMHIGHAYSFSQQDFVARYKRMTGHEIFFPFGTDDNGLPTEKLIQKEKNVNLRHLSRQDAIKVCLEYLKEERPKFVQDWKNIGMSCDFDLSYSTIDSHCRKVSQRTFIQLAKKGLAYRKEAPILWDTMFQSAIAQAELEDVEKETFFNDILFKLDSGEIITIATTRPELLGGCVAIFVHPEDIRYKALIGKLASSPIYNQKVRIMADEAVDMEKGTGIVMCCTFGDQKDIEWYKKYNLDLKVVITKDGKMNELAGKYVGMKIEDARKEIIEDLKIENLLVSQKKIVHAVNVGERSGRPVEIINSMQWYIGYLNRKEQFLAASKELNWYPDHMKHRLENWIKGLNWDWSISRQRHFGVPIPAWYCKKCGEAVYASENQLPVDPTKDKPSVSSCPKCKCCEFVAEEDVFDTWFTSGSTPEIAMELVDDESVKKKLNVFDLRPQAHDIINFWLFYTLVKKQLLETKNPWKNIAISGWVLDPSGEKMSKSKGNTIAPQQIVEKFCADALRFGAGSTKLGQDIPYQEKELVNGIKVINKLYNASKFASMLLKDFKKEDVSFKFDSLRSIDRWIVSKLQFVVKESCENFENYDYSKAKALFENYFMQDIANDYLEIVKQRLWKPEESGVENAKKAQQALYHVLYSVLRGFAPVLVYITEDIYQNFYKQYNEEKSIHLTSYPKYDKKFDDANVVELGNKFVEVVGIVRKFKAEKQVTMKEPLKRLEITCSKELKEFIEDSIYDLKAVTSACEVVFKLGEFAVSIEK